MFLQVYVENNKLSGHEANELIRLNEKYAAAIDAAHGYVLVDDNSIDAVFLNDAGYGYGYGPMERTLENYELAYKMALQIS